MDSLICELCHATFSNIDELAEHKAKLSTFNCSYCDFMFHTAQEVGIHILLTHSTVDYELFVGGLFPDDVTVKEYNDSEKKAKDTGGSDSGLLPCKNNAIDKGGTDSSESVDKGKSVESGKTSKPAVVFIASESSSRKQKRKGSHPRKLVAISSEDATPDITTFVCKHCKRTFTKERHFVGHKCMAKGDYVDSIKEVDSDEDDESGVDAGAEDFSDDTDFTSEDEDRDVEFPPLKKIKQEVEDDEIYFFSEESDDACVATVKEEEPRRIRGRGSRGSRGGRQKNLVVVEEDTPLEFLPFNRLQDNETDLNKENQPFSEAVDQDDTPEDGDAQVKYNVPVFSTEEERLAVEEQLKKIDLSIVDHLFSKRKIDNTSCKHEYSCNVCSRVFPKKPKIRRHCLTHTDFKPYECTRCDQCFPAKFKMLSHMRIHTGNYYRCSLCDFKTIYRTQVARHEATHSIIRPVCKLCLSDFSTLTSLEKHIRKIHTDEEGKRYLLTVKSKQSMLFVCQICKRRFANQANRDRHMLVHSNQANRDGHQAENDQSSTVDSITEYRDMFRCRLCSYTSSKYISLEAHFTKHRLVYVCCVCCTAFISASRLKQHLQEHIDEASKSISVSENQEEQSNEDKVIAISIPETKGSDQVIEAVLESQNDHSEVTVVSSGKYENQTQSQQPSGSDKSISIERNSELSSAQETPSAETNTPSEVVMEDSENPTDLAKTVESLLEKPAETSQEQMDSSTAAGTVIFASGEDVDSAIAKAIQSVKLNQKLAEEQDNPGGSFSTFYVVSQDTGLETLFGESINHSWYIPEPDGSLLAYYHDNISDDLLDKSVDEKSCSEPSPYQSSKTSAAEKLTPEELQKVERLPPDLSAVIKENYKPLSENVFRQIQEAFGESECEYCGRRYQTKSVLDRHVLSHTDDKPFKCDLCNYSSVTKDCLKRHRETTHEGKKYPCKDCDFYAQSKGALWHHRKKNHRIFDGKCPVCEIEIPTSDALRPHILAEHPEISRQEMLKLIGSYYQVSSRLGRRSYRCSICCRVFINIADFRRHMWIHEGIRPFKCPQCSYRGRSRNNLNMHLLTHSTDRQFHCEEDNKVYKYRKGLKLHKKSIHEDRMFSCDKCDYKAAQKISVKKHMEIHEKKTYTCDQCDYTTTQIYYFRRHKESHEGKLIYSCDLCDYNTNDKFYVVKHMETHTGKVLYKCELCNYTTPLKTHFRKHQEGHEGKLAYNCDRCNFSTTQKRYLVRHMEIHDAKQFYSCDKCDYNATQKCLLKRHLETHEEKEMYNCEECEFNTTSKNDFRTHILTHDGKEVYTCDKCAYTTTGKWRLKRHMSIHDMSRLYNCDQCGFSTNMKLSFKKHMDAHAGKIVYSCYKCDFSTPEKEDLKMHMGTHEQEMLYSCDKCDYTTNQKFYFTRHIENHEGKILHTCDRCDYNTINRNQLRRHMETHEGHMVYACDRCDYSASDKYDLKRHAGMHRITQQFVCEFCNYSSNTLKVMKAHYGRKHKEKIFNISAITANFNEGEHQRIFKCVSCACAFENVEELKDHIQTKHGLSLESLDFDPQEGLQIEIVTDAEAGDEMLEETIEPAQEMEVIHSKVLEAEDGLGHSEEAQIVELSELDDRTASEVDLIQQIIKQGVLDSQVTLQTVDDGQLVAVNPEAIIVQDDGQEVVLDGDYVIQYVPHDSGETQESEVTLQEVVLEAAE